jgi:hypothetical protein
VTDAPGNKANKKQVSAHKTNARVNLYNHEVPTVKPTGTPFELHIDVHKSKK